MFVDDALVVGVGGDEGLDGEVVDRAGDAAAGVVDQRDGVVGEQRVVAAGLGEVVGDVGGRFGESEPVEVVADGDALVEGGEGAELEAPPQWVGPAGSAPGVSGRPCRCWSTAAAVRVVRR